jgi:hypothetical protein
MSRRSDVAILTAASVVFLCLVAGAARELGTNYEEAVAYVLAPLDVGASGGPASPAGAAPRFVVSTQLPRLAFEPRDGLRLPLLNQPYMTDHLSYGGIVLAALGIEPLWAARLWHAVFGVALLWMLYDVGLSLGLGRRTALMAVVLAATGLPLTFMYTWARFDESLASFGTVAVLAAALRYRRDPSTGWIWAATFATALAVSGKLTAIWPLAALAFAGWIAGWRPPPPSRMLLPALAGATFLAPMLGLAVAGPATTTEVGRRLAFLRDLFSSDAIPGAAANLIDYLGSWGSILSQAMRGAEGHGVNVVNWALVTIALVWLVARALSPGAPLRRHRFETQALGFLAVIFVLVAMFYREHRDYQFCLLVPLYALPWAAFLDWCARRWMDAWAPAWLAAVLVCAVPLAAHLRDQRLFLEDLGRSRNAMFDLHAQRESARWLDEQQVPRPIVVTFYATGTYELLTRGTVRPMYRFPMFRHANDGSFVPDYAAVWHQLLAEEPDRDRWALLPLGDNPIEARHFDEPAIRASLRTIPGAEPVRTFSSRHGVPLLELWRIPAAAS